MLSFVTVMQLPVCFICCIVVQHLNDSGFETPFPSTVPLYSSPQKQVQNAHMQQTRDQMYERTVGYLKAERLHTKVNSKEVHNPRGHYLRVVSVEKGTWCWFVERFAFVMNEA